MRYLRPNYKEKLIHNTDIDLKKKSIYIINKNLETKIRYINIQTENNEKDKVRI